MFKASDSDFEHPVNCLDSYYKNKRYVQETFYFDVILPYENLFLG